MNRLSDPELREYKRCELLNFDLTTRLRAR